MYNGYTCRGCWSLGTACGKCDKCMKTRPKYHYRKEEYLQPLCIDEARCITNGSFRCIWDYSLWPFIQKCIIAQAIHRSFSVKIPINSLIIKGFNRSWSLDIIEKEIRDMGYSYNINQMELDWIEIGW